jgi:ATP-dependent helicase/DNAse subunit B
VISCVGSLKTAAVEGPFGLRTNRMNRGNRPLEIKNPGGRTIYLVGKIDRVDVAELAGECLGAVVISRVQTRNSSRKVLYGINIQLLTYILALSQRGISRRSPHPRSRRFIFL